MANEIMNSNNISTLVNKELKSNLKTMLTALSDGKKATWRYAVSCSNIVTGEQFKDDFESLAKFAEFCNMTKGAISQMTGAIKFVNRRELVPKNKAGKADYSNMVVTVSNAYMLSTIKEDEYESFVKSTEMTEEDIFRLSQNELKKLIKAWKDSKAIETTGEEKTEKETEEKETEENKEVSVKVDTKEKALTAIVTLMKQFNITIPEIEEQAKQLTI